MSLRRENLTFLILLLLGAALRLFQLGEESIWLDELHSLNLARAGSVGDIVRTAARDVHPPAYFILLNLWESVFPDSLKSARGLSALLSIVSIFFFWRLAREAGGAVTALFAAALFALSPYQLWYAQEVRMYSLLVLGEVMTIFFLLRFLASGPEPRRRKILDALGLLLSTALLVNTHFLYPFILTFVGIYWLIRIVGSTDRSRAQWTGFAVWIAWSLLWILPLAAQLLSRAETGENVSWIPPLSAATFGGIVQAFSYGVFIDPRPGWIVWPLALSFLLAAVAGAVLRSRNSNEGNSGPDPRALAITLLFCTLALPVVVSVFRPIVFFGQRYLIIATIPFYLLVGHGWAQLWERRSARGLFVLAPIALVAIAGMVRYHWDYFDSYQKRRFDLAAELLDDRFQEGDAIVVVPGRNADCLRLYLKQPFEILPERMNEIRTWTGNHRGATLWFVDIEERPAALELRATLDMQRGRPNIVETADIPGQTLRWTAYRN